MNEFTSAGWSIAIALVTIVSLVACMVLLLAARRRKMSAADDTTGHVWDEDLREWNNPLPRWWVGLFVITVVFSAVYLLLYPGLGSYEGTLKWNSFAQHDKEMADARAAMAPLYAKFASLGAEALVKDTKAMAIGERIFTNECAGCHGADARGSKGFPNLTDGDWLWGGEFDKIKETIAQGRQGVMPPMAAAVGGAEDVRNVAHYVLSLSGSPHDGVAAQLGKPKFGACAACHGPDGKGNPALGAPNLTDKVWLHGWGEQSVVALVTQGKTNVMPALSQRLSAEQIHVVAAYVWGLSRAGAAASN
jgi:cytochrome c oxidase cbb3-type subunit 3